MRKVLLKLLLTDSRVIPITIKVVLLGLAAAKVLPLGRPYNADSF
jgi:hypothetical protein